MGVSSPLQTLSGDTLNIMGSISFFLEQKRSEFNVITGISRRMMDFLFFLALFLIYNLVFLWVRMVLLF